MAEAETESEQEQQRVIAEFSNTQIFPSWYKYDMHQGDAKNLLILLCTMGVLSDYLEANVQYEDEADDADFDDFFNFNEDIKINPNTGRIKSLCLRRFIPDEGANAPFNLLPIIELFQDLESIDLEECHLLPIELTNLPLLTEFRFRFCTCNLSEIIPEGLRLLSVKKMALCQILYETTNDCFSSFLKLFSRSLEEIYIENVSSKEKNKILRVLQNDDLSFRHNLKTIRLIFCDINEDDLEKLLFEIRPMFPNLRELDLETNYIKSFVSIKNRILSQTQMMSLSTISSSSSSQSLRILSDNNNLCELNLSGNPVMKHIIVSKDDVDRVNNTDTDTDMRNSKKPNTDSNEEKRALLVLLNTFNTISNLGLKCNILYGDYDPTIKQVLKTNIAGTKFIMGGGERKQQRRRRDSSDKNDKTSVTTTKINSVLWPTILERAFKKSADIYNNDDGCGNKVINSRAKCGTGVFYLVKHCWPLFMEDHLCIHNNKKDGTTTNDVHSNSINSDDSMNRNNMRQVRRNRKRKCNRNSS